MQIKGTVSDFLSFLSCIFLSAHVMSRQAWDMALTVLALVFGDDILFLFCDVTVQMSFILSEMWEELLELLVMPEMRRLLSQLP